MVVNYWTSAIFEKYYLRKYCDVFPSRKLSSHEKRVQFLSFQLQTAGQLHLVVIKETFSRVIASRRKRPQCRGMNICQRAHLGVGFEESSGTLSCHTCIASGGGKHPRTFSTVGFDHWEHGRLVVGRPGVRLSSRVKKAELCPLRQGMKTECGTRRAVKNRFRRLEFGFRLRSAEKELYDQLGFKVPN
ncbi:hypothetical protein AVEN_44722-1 [Araneus ventricosus]|uniref:Uncharacterized protein n=1 Tax=Araneus ventricosus TaxID=182803 RepID=A0A4Y2VK77_ARAVE|nr:hypothetical protein AVEN_44722-1 [Araneus ventricosus]